MRCKSVGFGTETSWFRDDIQNYVSYPGVNELEISQTDFVWIYASFTRRKFTPGVNLHGSRRNDAL